MMDAEGGPSGPDPPRDPESSATGELPLPPGPGRESEGGPTRGSGGVDPIVGHSEGGGGQSWSAPIPQCGGVLELGVQGAHIP